MSCWGSQVLPACAPHFAPTLSWCSQPCKAGSVISVQGKRLIYIEITGPEDRVLGRPVSAGLHLKWRWRHRPLSSIKKWVGWVGAADAGLQGGGVWGQVGWWGVRKG